MNNINFNEINNINQLDQYLNSLEVSNIGWDGKRKFHSSLDGRDLSINQILQKLSDCSKDKYFVGSQLTETELAQVFEIIKKVEDLDKASYAKLAKSNRLIRIAHWFTSVFGTKLKGQSSFLGFHNIEKREVFLSQIKALNRSFFEKTFLHHIVPTELSDQVKQALNYSNEHYYNQPYTDTHIRKREAKWKVNGEVIQRYNHGLVHSVRKAFYIPFMIEYFERNGTDHLSKELQELFKKEGKENVIAKLQIVMAFEVAGRDSECGVKDSTKIYNRYLQQSKEAFLKYCHESDLVGEGKLFKNEEELEHYARAITDKYPNKFLGDKMDVLAAITDATHTLDLFRCYGPWCIKGGLESLNIYSKHKNNSDLWSLAKFCQKSVKITGDRLMTEFVDTEIPTRRPKFKNNDVKAYAFLNFRLRRPQTFLKCSKDAGACWELLQKVPPPIFHSKGETTYSYLKDYNKQAKPSSDVKSVSADSIKGLNSSLEGSRNKIDELSDILSETRAVIRLVNTENNAFQFEMKMMDDPVFFRPLRRAPSDRDYVLSNRTRKEVIERGYQDRVPLLQQTDKDAKISEEKSNPVVRTEDQIPEKLSVRDKIKMIEQGYQDQVPLLQQKDKDAKTSNEKWNPVDRTQDRGKPRFTQFTKKLSVSLLRKDGKVIHFKGRWPQEYYHYRPVGMLYNVDQLDQKNQKFVFDYDVNTSSKFWIGKDSAAEVDKKQGRESDLTLKDLQKKLDQQVESGEDPIALPFIKMQHAPNEMLMGLSKQALKAVFAVNDTPQERIRTFLHAVYLSQDHGVHVPVLIIDGKKPPRVYSQEDLQKDLQTLNRKKPKIFRELLSCFYSRDEMKEIQDMPQDLFKKCTELMDESILPKKTRILTQSKEVEG